MRLLITADLHYNHPRSRALADDVIEQMNRAGGDVLLVVGDSAVSDGDALERCLSRFRFDGPRLFVAGNHELWTRGADSYELFCNGLPQRVRALGWGWLQTEPFVAREAGFAIVGSIGWYDYSFAAAHLEIPRRFYEHKVSPGAAEKLPEFAHLLEGHDDVSDRSRQIVARWNDGKFVKLKRTDGEFLDELLAELKSQLDSLRDVPRIIAAIHHVPMHELLPPRHGSQWDFARAYLGSDRIGQLVSQYPNVKSIVCGHSHFGVEATVGGIHAINIGSGYRSKTFRTMNF